MLRYTYDRLKSAVSMQIVGLTGTIGSGKSTVSAMLVANGYEVIDCDRLVRDLQARGGAGHAAVVAAGFPTTPSGELDRLSEAHTVRRCRGHLRGQRFPVGFDAVSRPRRRP